MADRPRPGSRHRSRAATAVVGLVVVACASCAVPRTDSAAGPALASPGATVRPAPTSATPTVQATAATSSPTTVVPTTSSSVTPTASATVSTTAEIDLRGDTISFGPPTRSVHFSRPADWTETRVTTSDGARARNRTIFRSPDSGLSLTVEIAPATTSSPLTAAFGAQAARSDRGTPGYRLVRIENGPGAGATWEFLSTVDGVARHSADWFATVGSTDLAVFVTGAARDWDAAHDVWGQVVDSVEAGEEPPGYSGPSAPATPTTTPSGSPTPVPTPTEAPTDGATVAPAPTPGPGRTIRPGKTKDPVETKKPKDD